MSKNDAIQKWLNCLDKRIYLQGCRDSSIAIIFAGVTATIFYEIMFKKETNKAVELKDEITKSEE